MCASQNRDSQRDAIDHALGEIMEQHFEAVLTPTNEGGYHVLCDGHVGYRIDIDGEWGAF